MSSFDDPVLDEIVATVPLPVFQSTGNVFHDLVSCIVEQQIHYRSTKGTFRRYLERAGLEALTVETYEVFEEKGLADAKVSHRKREALVHIVDFFREDETPWATLPDEGIQRLLSQIKGVGPWTIDMILLYTLERPDIFPADDYHLKNAMLHVYGTDKKARMKEIAEAWQPQRSLGVRYLLAWKDWQQEVMR